jgi:hypothetical protein
LTIICFESDWRVLIGDGLGEEQRQRASKADSRPENKKAMLYTPCVETTPMAWAILGISVGSITEKTNISIKAAPRADGQTIKKNR